MNNPRTLKTAQDELDIKVGKHRQVDESDIKNLVYLQAIIKETLQLYPAAPLSVPCEAMEGCTMAGFHIQAGTRLLVNLWKLHKDPRIWLDPLEFQPEKFLTKHVDLDVKGQNFEFLPFGSGRRPQEITVFGLLATICLLLETALNAKRNKIKEGKRPPEPSGQWPLIGHLHLLGADKLLHRKLGDMADKYGPIFCIHLGLRKALVVSRWEVAKECYTTNDKKLTFSPPSTLELIRKVEQFLVCRPQKIN
ncbi:hypothetical protein AAG906_037767 [Vitis piasezkii]